MFLVSFPAVLGYAAAAVACVVLGYLTHLLHAWVVAKIARQKACLHLEETGTVVEERLARARREALREAGALRQSAVRDLEEEREALRELERRLGERARDLSEREQELSVKQEGVTSLRRDLRQQERGLRHLRRRLGRVHAEGRRILLGLLETTEEAHQARYLEAIDREVRRDMGRYVERERAALEEEGESRARLIVDRVTGRMAVSHARDERPSGVELDSIERLERCGFQPGSPLFKAFEEAAHVELAVDAEGRQVSFNTLDGVRREVARRALPRILGLPAGGDEPASGERRRKRGGRRRRNGGGPPPEAWTPATVQALVKRLSHDVRRVLNRQGKQAAGSLKLAGSDPLFESLGRLNYRTSYGQNILKHSHEVAVLGGLLGAEVGLDPGLAKRCAFLHDLGKGIDHEVEGGHPEIGGRLARECGESDVVINAIEAHHEDVPRTSLYPLIVQAADAISGARPGARRRTAEKYLLRLGQIEDIASARPGVESAYVIQAGREVRVILDADRTTDEDARQVAGAVARELEKEMNFPGRIKVTVIREHRVSAVAR